MAQNQIVLLLRRGRVVEVVEVARLGSGPLLGRRARRNGQFLRNEPMVRILRLEDVLLLMLLHELSV